MLIENISPSSTAQGALVVPVSDTLAIANDTRVICTAALAGHDCPKGQLRVALVHHEHVFDLLTAVPAPFQRRRGVHGKGGPALDDSSPRPAQSICLASCGSGPSAWVSASAQTAGWSDALPSWNDGAAKQAILSFVRETTVPANPKVVAAEERIATFDQEGTLCVEHRVYSQMMY